MREIEELVRAAVGQAEYERQAPVDAGLLAEALGEEHGHEGRCSRYSAAVSAATDRASPYLEASQVNTWKTRDAQVRAKRRVRSGG